MTVRAEGVPPWYDGRPAPREGCHCAVCQWCRGDDGVIAFGIGGPVRPGDPEWPRLLRLAQERTK